MNHTSSSPLRVAHLLPTLSIGGVRRYIEQISKYTAQRAVNYVVPIFSHPSRPLYPIQDTQLIPLNFSPCEIADHERITDSIAATLLKYNVDILHSHHVYADIYSMPATTIAACSRTIRTVHGILQFSPEEGLSKETVRYDWSETEIANELAVEPLCDLTICVSTEVQTKIVSYGIAYSKTRVIHNGVDTNSFAPASLIRAKSARRHLQLSTHDLVIGFLGRLEPSKNPLALISIASALKQLSPQPIQFVMQGTGPQECELKRQITEKDLEGTFQLWPETADVAPFYDAIDIFLSPSLAEGFPFAVLEALSSGVPVVAANVGGISELIRDGLDGFLFDPCNCTSAIEKLSLLLQPILRNEIRKQSRLRVKESFRAETQIAKIAQLYEAVKI